MKKRSDAALVPRISKMMDGWKPIWGQTGLISQTEKQTPISDRKWDLDTDQSNAEVIETKVNDQEAKLVQDVLASLKRSAELANKKITSVYYINIDGKKTKVSAKKSDTSGARELPLRQLTTATPQVHGSSSAYKEGIDDFVDNGEFVCEGNYSGFYADAKKDCRVYYQCGTTTIDTYVCPKGTRFDEKTTFCEAADKVSCPRQ